METVVNLSDAQQLAFEKFKALVGDDQMDAIIAAGPEVFLSRLEAFMAFEARLVGQVYDYITSVMPARHASVTDSEPKARPLVLNAKTFQDKKEGNLLLWIREMEVAISSALQH